MIKKPDFSIKEKNRRLKGVFTMEYFVVFIVAFGAFIMFMPYLTQMISGKFKDVTDEFGAGRQYEPYGEQKTTITDYACVSNCYYLCCTAYFSTADPYDPGWDCCCTGACMCKPIVDPLIQQAYNDCLIECENQCVYN